MTPAPVEPRSWSPLKWAVMVACILGLQVIFFYWFIVPPGLPPRPRPPGLALSLPAGQPVAPPGLISPSVLVRADAHGFSGKAWLQIPPVTYDPQESNPPPFLLSLQTGRLGAAITQTLSNNLSRPFEVASRPGPRFDDWNYSSPLNTPAPESTLTVEGELAGRPLLAKPELKLQPADTILSNTVVYVVVDAEGRVFAPPVLAQTDTAGTPNPAEADALATAADLRFEPLLRSPGQARPATFSLTPGRLVFRWQTVAKPAAATNDAAAGRSP